MNKKEYHLPGGRTAVFEYDICGIGKITLEAMDAIMDRLINTEWIPCSEKLPEKDVVVLVSLKSETRCIYGEYRRIEFGKYSDIRFDIDGSGWMYLDESGADFWNDLEEDDVLAWMPLPKPYEEEEK